MSDHEHSPIFHQSLSQPHNPPHPHPTHPNHTPVPSPGGKGKAPTDPLPILSPNISHHVFDLTPSPSASTSSYPCPSPNSHSPEFHSFDNTTIDPALVQDLYDNDEMSFISAKGKGKDIPPALPPLSFSNIDLDYHHGSWSTFGSVPSPGPSSYGSVASPVQNIAHSTSPDDTAPVLSPTSTTSVGAAYTNLPTRHIPSRCQSLSNLSVRSTPSLASLTMSKIKVKLGPSTTTQSNLARKLLLGKRGDAVASSETASLAAAGSTSPATSSSSLDPSVVPWYAAPLQYDLDAVVPPAFVRPRAGTESKLNAKPSRFAFRTKGRSKSSPAPFSALDFVPAASTDIFKPLPLLRRNYIDQILPKELQIQILRCFVQLFEDDHANNIAEGRWTISKAISSRHQLVGRDRGIRELLKLAMVSRSWQTLVFDGQLWTDLDLHSFPGLPTPILLRLTRSGGPFIRKINLLGHCHLQALTLTDIAGHLCPKDTLPYTHLTAINLQGCSSLTTHSLHDLLTRCASLQKLCLKGLAAVTNTTCSLLGTICLRLEQLDLNRCCNMDAEGLRCLFDTILEQGEPSRLKELRVSGLKNMDDATMRVLGKAAPHLEVLDLSYVRKLHNSALEAFVAVDDTFDYARYGMEIVRLNALQIGREYANDGYYLRRVTKLRHLCLSFCIMLTDMACSNIAYTVPHLEYLEMAGIGADLKDDGLVQLLNTTPRIRRLDLEDAVDITDSALSSITPVPSPSNSNQDEPPQPGHALEWLIVSHAGNISDEAFLALIRACPKLRVLEADNTRLSGSTLREFVNLNRQRKGLDAKTVAIDCRGVTEGIVKELSTKGAIRPRLGVRAFWARRLGYVDGKDEACEDDLKIGQDECDRERVVVKTFYSWQTVDAVRTAREKRRKATSRRAGSPGSDFSGDAFDNDVGNGAGRTGGLTRWWSPNGRSGSGRSSPPIIPDMSNDACIVM